MKTVLYARISTNDSKQNLDNQLIPLRKYAESLDFEIVNEYLDRASGGDSNRPQFQLMLMDARYRKFDLILVWSLDRFSREGILNTLSYLRTLRNYKVALKSLQEAWLDTRDTGMGELLLAIFSWVAKQEREHLVERIKAGLKNAQNVGKRGKDKGRRRTSGYTNRWLKLRNKQTSPEQFSNFIH